MPYYIKFFLYHEGTNFENMFICLIPFAGRMNQSKTALFLVCGFAATFKFMRHQNVSVITMTCTWTESNKNNKQKG